MWSIAASPSLDGLGGVGDGVRVHDAADHAARTTAQTVTRRARLEALSVEWLIVSLQVGSVLLATKAR
jgi:hypothetical protein